MAYPSSLDELTDGVPSDGAAPTTALDNATYPHDDHHRALATAVEAIETELGTDPSGPAPTVKARIAATETVANAALPAAAADALYQPLDLDLAAVAALPAPASTITGAAQKASNLADLDSPSTARTNLGLGDAAVLEVGTTTGTVAAGDDTRFGPSDPGTIAAPDIFTVSGAVGSISMAIGYMSTVPPSVAAGGYHQVQLALDAGYTVNAARFGVAATGLTGVGDGSYSHMFGFVGMSAGIDLYVRVRAVDRFGNRSAWKNYGSPTPVQAGGHVETFTHIIDGAGSALTTGIKGHLEVPVGCTITQATLLADQSGSAVVDIFRSTYSAFSPPTHPAVGDKITAAAPPTITAATKSQDTTLNGWTTSLAAGDILAFNVTSCTSITRLTCSLKVLRT